MQQSSISGITQIRCFYRFTVNLCFASAASFAPVISSCIRYPAVPVCKKCAKMCRAKISTLKQVSDFYSKFRACSSATRITLQSPSGCSLGRLRHISVQSLAPMIPQSFFSIIYRTACGPASSHFRHCRWHNPERELLRWAA